jgi:hypothetical protein
MQKSKFDLVSLLVIVVLLGLLTLMLLPAISASQRMSSMPPIAARGRDIYVAITSANTDREPLGLPSVWPKSNPPTNNALDISKMNFANSTDYFWALYDGDHLGTAQHDPYVKGFDLSKLSGAGVPVHPGQGRLKPKNNMWTIAKNVREEMEDIIPVLVTRNVAAESLVADLTTVSDRRLFFDEEWMTPFGRKGFVMIRKGGGTFNQTAKYATQRVLYNSQTFMTTIPGSQAPRLGYLTPIKEVIPSEAVYQACAASHANDWKGWRYYWIMDGVKVWSKMGFEILKYLLIIGLILGAFIFVRGFFNEQAKAKLSVMGPAYRILFWLAVTAYLCCLLMGCIGYRYRTLFLCFTLAFAITVQVLGCLYMVVWKRKTGNVESYRKAFGLMLMAPLLAFLGLVIVFVVIVVFAHVLASLC